MRNRYENLNAPSKPILVHAHIFYKEKWLEMKECISNLFSLSDTNPCSLIVTLSEPYADIIADIKQSFSNAQTIILSNRGYDVGPFVHILNQVNLDEFSLVAKLHTKRDMPIGARLNGKDVSKAKWRNYALAFCKTKENVCKCLQAFNDNEQLGMVANYHLINTKEDFYDKKATREAKQMLEHLNLPCDQRIFVMGTMFMCKAALLKPLQKLKLTINDFEEFNGQRLSTSKAHTLERFLGFLITAQGYTIQDVTTNKIWWHKIKDTINRMISFFLRYKEGKDGKIKVKICKIPIPSKWVNRK